MTEPAPTLLSLVTAKVPEPGAPVAPDSPEHLLVSALLESGQYNPRAYGIQASYIHSLAAAHQFCCDYQELEGSAPPVALVAARFPSFRFTPGVGPAWAAHEVAQAQTDRVLRLGIASALGSVRDEAYPEAIATLRETVSSVTTASRPGTLVTDFTETRKAQASPCCPVPDGVLSRLTGGHGAGQLWLWAALWGVGKTFKLVEHAVAAAEGGWDVVFFSLEMPTQDILTRLRNQILTRGGRLALATPLDEQEQLVGAWSGGRGRIEVRGPDQGRVDTSTIAGAVEHPRTLVIVDYVAKMFSSDGRHAGTGWEVISLVSKELQQTAGLLSIPILGAAQVNRTGQLAGTISLEQDADLIVEQKRVADKVNSIRVNTLVKSRRTALPAPWFSRFDPVGARFDDITGEEAMGLRLAEESLLYT